MSWEAIGAGILAFVALLTGFFIWLLWQLWTELGALKETRQMEKQRFASGINTPLGSVEADASGSLDEGLTAGMSASLTPNAGAAASGVGGALAYNALLGVAGVWTVPLIAGLAGAVWLYKRQKDAKAHPPGP